MPSVVFNVVLAGDTFWHLRLFVCSILEQADARLRLVTNGCSEETVAEVTRFADRRPDRVVEVLDAFPDRMVAHGVALDAVRRQRDDGELFCFLDPDIKACGPFLDDFLVILRECDGVTSGAELWNDDNVVPADHLGVGGRHFYDSRGFVFGSPHFGMYRRVPLDETAQRWDVGFGSAGPDLSEAARARLHEAGHRYLVYDTGKILNAFFQLDGHSLRHVEHPALLHVGGLSHFLSPGGDGAESGEVRTPDWAQAGGMQPRLEVARYTALVIRSVLEGREVPPVPADSVPDLGDRLATVRLEMADLAERYGRC